MTVIEWLFKVCALFRTERYDPIELVHEYKTDEQVQTSEGWSRNGG